MKNPLYILLVIIALLFLGTGCSIDTGILNSGGTSDPRKLIGIAYHRMYEQNRVQGAINVLNQSIYRSEQRDDLWALATSHNMIAFAYLQLERHDKVKYHYEEALEIAKENDFDCELAHSYIGLALFHGANGNKKLFLDYKSMANVCLSQIVNNVSKGIREYEFGQKAVDIVMKRVEELNELNINFETVEVERWLNKPQRRIF
tara:strand:+ start:103 stop:711 length:609 start_codon:yes stop_codon:yes gene_type:complete